MIHSSGRSDVGSCQVNTDTLTEKDNGKFNTTVVLSNGMLIIHYQGGQACSNGTWYWEAGICRTGKILASTFRYFCISSTQSFYHFPQILSSGDIRETVINVMCDHSLSDMEIEVGYLVEESHCVYQATAYSGIPCEKVGFIWHGRGQNCQSIGSWTSFNFGLSNRILQVSHPRKRRITPVVAHY